MALLLAAHLAGAESAGHPSQVGPLSRVHVSLQLPLEKETLQNGLKVVMDAHQGTATVAVCILLDVGRRDEQEGEAGFTQFIEYAAQRQVGPSVYARGGQLSSRTGLDRSEFCLVLPSPELGLGVWAVRVFLDNALAQQAAELPEIRAEALRALYARGADELGEHHLWSLAFRGYWRFERSSEASLLAIDASRAEGLGSFYRRHYRPERAVLAVSGDFCVDRLRELAAGGLGDVRPRDVPGPPFARSLLRQRTERFAAVSVSGLEAPVIYAGWVIPGWGRRGNTALELAAILLGGGGASSLERELVLGRRWARRVQAYVVDQQDLGLFVIRLEMSASATLDQVEQVLGAELSRLARAGPTERELDRARAVLESESLAEFQTALGRARALAALELVAGDARALGRQRERYTAVTPADVSQAVSAHLLPETRVLVEVHPPHWQSPGEVAMVRFHLVDKGETVSGIAKRYGISTSALVAANKLNPRRPIYPGDKLKLPPGAVDSRRARPSKPSGARQAPRTSPPAKSGAATETPTAAPPGRTHVVQPGQTLGGIARSNGITIEDLVQANQIDPKRPIRVGQKLRIPPKKR